jgi:hypothetical protein
MGLPFVSDGERGALLMLGGGHSAKEKVEEVKASGGDKWAIGTAYHWWKAQGVDCTFFSAHASRAAIPNVQGVARAVVACQTHPDVLKELVKTADVTLFDLVDDGGARYTTSVTCVPMLACRMGYKEVHLYGCDSSYGDRSHVNFHNDDPLLIQVTVDGEEFVTGIEFMGQAEFMSWLVRNAPKVYKNHSGGLLAAMVRNWDYDVTKVSQEVQNCIIHEETSNA